MRFYNYKSKSLRPKPVDLVFSVVVVSPTSELGFENSNSGFQTPPILTWMNYFYDNNS